MEKKLHTGHFILLVCIVASLFMLIQVARHWTTKASNVVNEKVDKLLENEKDKASLKKQTALILEQKDALQTQSGIIEKLGGVIVDLNNRITGDLPDFLEYIEIQQDDLLKAIGKGHVDNHAPFLLYNDGIEPHHESFVRQIVESQNCSLGTSGYYKSGVLVAVAQDYKSKGFIAVRTTCVLARQDKKMFISDATYPTTTTLPFNHINDETSMSFGVVFIGNGQSDTFPDQQYVSGINSKALSKLIVNLPRE